MPKAINASKPAVKADNTKPQAKNEETAPKKTVKSKKA